MSDEAGFYAYNLKHTLEAQIDLYEQDREKYWNAALSEGDYVFMNAAYEQAEKFAEAVCSGAETLTSTGQMDADVRHLDNELKRVENYDKYANQVFSRIMASEGSWDDKKRQVLELMKERPPNPGDEESPLRLVYEKLFIKFSWDAVSVIEKRVERVLGLFGLVLPIKPSPETQAFLSRVARCYISGFDPECVILCRAVLDTAFRDAVPTEVCERHCQKDSQHDFTLGNRIHAAVKERYIDGHTRRLAIEVKERGDKAVHYQPDITQDILGTIRDTLIVLEELHKSR
jgi:hypothetical protein